MNISDRGFTLGGNQLNNVYNSEQPKSEAVKGAGEIPLSANNMLAKGDVGQMFHGEILDITNNLVSIAMDGKGIINARMQDFVSLNIGDSITFQIQENNGQSVLIKPQPQSAELMKDTAILKVLDANGLMPTEKNFQIAEALMNKGMPVDKGHMQQLIGQSYKFPDASLDTLTSLNKLGIEVNETNINQYQDYMNNSHQLSANLNELASNIADFSTSAFSELEQSGTVADMLELNKEILAVISDSEDACGEAVQDIRVNPEAALKENAAMWELTEQNNTEKASLFDGKTDINGNLQIADKASLADNATNQAGSIFEKTELGSELGDLSEKTGIDREKLDQIFDKLNKMGFDRESLAKVAKESDTPIKLMNNIDSIISNNGENIPENAIKDLLTSKEFNTILNESTKRKFSLNPEKMENPKEIDDLYNKIYDKTNRLMDTLSHSGAGDSSNLNQSAKSVQERIDFMQNLNNMYVYAQIPVNTHSSEMNSDLFVYMNKKAMKNSKEEISALLHLDMEHLGATDVHVSLHGNTVHTRFYVEDEISARVLDEHMTMLEKAVNESGLSLTNEVITREPALNTGKNMVVDEMLGSELEQSVKRYSFDVRM